MKNIRRLIQLCKADLNGGPVYLSNDGDIVSCFDEDANPFSFETATNDIRDWLEDNVFDEEETIYGDDDEVLETITIIGSRTYEIVKLVGSDLYPYVR